MLHVARRYTVFKTQQDCQQFVKHLSCGMRGVKQFQTLLRAFDFHCGDVTDDVSGLLFSLEWQPIVDAEVKTFEIFESEY